MGWHTRQAEFRLNKHGGTWGAWETKRIYMSLQPNSLAAFVQRPVQRVGPEHDFSSIFEELGQIIGLLINFSVF